MNCAPHKAHGVTTAAHRIVSRGGRDAPMCVACWKLTERGGNPWPPKKDNPRIHADSRGEEKQQQSRDRSERSEREGAVSTTEAKKVMKPRYDVQAMIAEYAKGNGPGAAELARKYQTQPGNIRKVLKAAGVFVYERRPMTGPAAKAAPAKRGRPAKAATALVHVSGRAATEVPMESGREGAVPCAIPEGRVKVTLRAATVHFEGASAALKDQLAEIAKFLGVPKDE